MPRKKFWRKSEARKRVMERQTLPPQSPAKLRAIQSPAKLQANQNPAKLQATQSMIKNHQRNNTNANKITQNSTKCDVMQNTQSPENSVIKTLEVHQCCQDISEKTADVVSVSFFTQIYPYFKVLLLRKTNKMLLKMLLNVVKQIQSIIFSPQNLSMLQSRITRHLPMFVHIQI
jgi:hypothetical protein